MARIVRPNDVHPRRATVYPPELAAAVEGRIKRALTEPAGLSQFGVNLTTLEPGAASSHRHWHAIEDEFIYVLEGVITLLTDEGAHSLLPGMAVGFPAGEANGHQLVNRSDKPVTYLEIGTRSPVDTVTYPDVDLAASKTGAAWTVTRKDGTSF